MELDQDMHQVRMNCQRRLGLHLLLCLFALGDSENKQKHNNEPWFKCLAIWMLHTGTHARILFVSFLFPFETNFVCRQLVECNVSWLLDTLVLFPSSMIEPACCCCGHSEDAWCYRKRASEDMDDMLDGITTTTTKKNDLKNDETCLRWCMITDWLLVSYVSMTDGDPIIHSLTAPDGLKTICSLPKSSNRCVEALLPIRCWSICAFPFRSFALCTIFL